MLCGNTEEAGVSTSRSVYIIKMLDDKYCSFAYAVCETTVLFMNFIMNFTCLYFYNNFTRVL